jgi:DNA polymerase-3 subunit delta'
VNITSLVLHKTASAQVDAFVAAPAHAVLLGGPAGTGKTHIAATAAAQLLGTTKPGLENHGYYRVITPVTGSISIEQIRDLIGFFRLKVPGQGVIKRVAVIQDADSMGTEAQNALLKLLEEPPADSVLILTSSQPERLLRTIRSRVQLLQLPAPDAAQLQAHFAAAGYTEAAIASALLRAGSNVAEAERLLNAKSDTPDATAHDAQDALERSGNAKLVLTELMLAL